MTVANNYQPIRQLGNGVTTDFSFNFRVLEDEQIVVYELPEGGEQQVVDSNEYTVNLTNSGGNVVFNTAPANGTVIVITRLTPQTQETPYKTSQGFPAAVVEGDFDKLTMMVQELQQDSDRSVKVDVTSGVTPDVLVNQVERIYESVDNIDTVADDISNVNTTAGSIANVNTTAGSIANVNTVAGIASDVATVAAISSDVSGVAQIATEVSGVYYSRGAVENVANNVNDVVNVSDNVLFVQTAANNISNINTVGNNISDVNTTAGSIANVNAVAGNASNINAVAGNATNINTVAGNASNINAVAGNASNINAVASDLTNIDAVAGDLTNIDNASSYAALAKQYAIGDPSEPTGNSAKYWAEQAATQAIPSQTGQSGKYLTTDGTDMNWASVAVLPSQTGQSGKFLTTDGTDPSWATVDALPSQTGQSGKFLTTDGTDASWADVDTLPSQTGHSGDVLTTDGTDASWVDTETIYPVVEIYVNGTEWYRVYSDGWVEQGGQLSSLGTTVVTVTLLKPFADTNYTITSCGHVNSTTGQYGYVRDAPTTTTIKFKGTGTVTKFYWMACGYGA